jgi:hypothetical protein
VASEEVLPHLRRNPGWFLEERSWLAQNYTFGVVKRKSKVFKSIFEVLLVPAFSD